MDILHFVFPLPFCCLAPYYYVIPIPFITGQRDLVYPQVLTTALLLLFLPCVILHLAITIPPALLLYAPHITTHTLPHYLLHSIPYYLLTLPVLHAIVCITILLFYLYFITPQDMDLAPAHYSTFHSHYDLVLLYLHRMPSQAALYYRPLTVCFPFYLPSVLVYFVITFLPHFACVARCGCYACHTHLYLPLFCHCACIILIPAGSLPLDMIPFYICIICLFPIFLCLFLSIIPYY